MDQARIRNFCIVAHIDHGKSTLADRVLELTHSVAERDMRAQYLDRMDLERERGITIKAQAVRLRYDLDGREFELNLIDTPGHVDFSYEVSRSLAACEGAVLLVDAAQGIEAQTLANFHLARDAGPHDRPGRQQDRPAPGDRRRDGPGGGRAGRSSRSGRDARLREDRTGVDDLLRAVIQRVPPPRGDPDAALRALIFDSSYDPYRGVIAYLRVVDGGLHGRSKIRFMSNGLTLESEEVGAFAPEATVLPSLDAGDVGYLVTGVKDVRQAKVGDTITLASDPAARRCTATRNQSRWSGAACIRRRARTTASCATRWTSFGLSDAALVFEPESSLALGFGFRCGFSACCTWRS
jgi:GTP-binding protein LepA